MKAIIAKQAAEHYDQLMECVLSEESSFPGTDRRHFGSGNSWTRRI